jgi:hypothetical protein
MESNDSRSRKTKDYWTYLEDNYKEVSNWPTWMRGESSSPCQQPKVDETAHTETDEPGE